MQYVYDDGGKLQKVIDACNIETSFTYDKRGNKLSMTNGKGNVNYYRYGAFGILTAAVNANGDTMSLKYDLMLNKARLLDENKHETLLSYNNMNLLTERKVADTNDVVSYKYDEAGNRVEMTDATGTTTYEYDESNQLTERTKNGTRELSYSYDEVGNVTSVTDNKGNTTEYGYDKSNRMTTVSFKVSGNTRTTTYTYDKNGNREAVIYHSGIREDYTYDKNNRLLKLTNSRPDGSIISSYDYTYDLAGRQISKTDSFGTTRYTYDADGRVKQVEAPGKTTVYMFDEAGNRMSMNESFASEQSSGYIDRKTNAEVKYVLKKSEYVYSNNNELLKLVEKMCDAGGKVLFSKVSVMKYDRNGNQTRQTVEYTKPKEDGATAAAPTFKGQVFGETANIAFEGMVENTMNYYDGFNRLKKTESIKTGLRTIVEFSYDGDDLRVRKAVKKSSGNYAEEVTNYLYDRQHVILETDGTGNIKARYVKGINYIARIDGSNKLSYMLYNGHGDVVQTVSQTGNVENRYDYDIFGMPTLTIESYNCSIRYAGEYYDAETGLIYLRARYYNPYTGRFISEDSYWGEDSNPLSLNLYTYCHNDPIQFVDPSGHSDQWEEDLLFGDYDHDGRRDDTSQSGGNSSSSGGSSSGTSGGSSSSGSSSSGGSRHDNDHDSNNSNDNNKNNTPAAPPPPDKTYNNTPTTTQNKDIHLETGSKGDDVKELQRLLIKYGYDRVVIDGKTYKLTVDGQFGKITRAAVNEFKNNNKLGNKGEYEGVVGNQTWGVLHSDKAVKDDVKSNNNNDKSYVKPNKTDYDNSNNTNQTDADKLVEVAENEFAKGFKEYTPPGSKEGDNKTPYGEWAGVNGQPWCAAFVSYCADNAGILNTKVPNYTNCTDGKNDYKQNGDFKSRSSGYTPKAGDVIFFTKNNGKTDYHTGIVIAYDDKTKIVYTIEGNSGDTVSKNKYSLDNKRIDGYGVNGGTSDGTIPINSSDGTNKKTK